MFNICFTKHFLNIYKPSVDVIKSPNVKWWLFIIYNCQLRWPQCLFMFNLCFTKHTLNIYKPFVDIIKSPNVKCILFIIYKHANHCVKPEIVWNTWPVSQPLGPIGPYQSYMTASWAGHTLTSSNGLYIS